MAESYGIVLVKGASYMYKGVRFINRKPAEVDLATRTHLVGTRYFRDVSIDTAEAKPIPVKRRKSKVTVKRKKREEPEAGMLNAEGGASATADRGKGEESYEV